MKKYFGLVIAVLFVAALFAPSAKALSYEPRVPRDFASGGDPLAIGNGNPTDAVPSGWGTIHNNAPQVGDEERVLFTIDSFYNSAGLSSTQTTGGLLGLAYDLTLVSISTTAPDPITGDVTLTLYYTGGQFQIWADATPEQSNLEDVFNPDNGGGTYDGAAPWLWSEGGGPGGTDAFPGVNDASDSDASLWLSGDFSQLVGAGGPIIVDGQPITKIESITLDFSTGSLQEASNGHLNALLLNPTGGSEGPIANGGNGDITGGTISAALYYPWDTSYLGSPEDDGGWQVYGSDPAILNLANGQITTPGGTITGLGSTVNAHISASSSLYVVPEPATLSLLGSALIGLMGIGARRKRA